MKKLIALLAAVGAVVFFWRKKHAGRRRLGHGFGHRVVVG